MATDTATVPVEETTAQLETTTIADAPVDDELPVEDSEATGEAAAPKEDPIQIKEKRRIYIGNLPFSATETEIKEFLGPYDLEYVTVPPHRFIASRNTGFAFVDFKSPEDAAKVIEELNGKTISDRTVFIQLAKPPSERRESRRGARGGFRRGRGGRTGGTRRRSPKSNELASEGQGDGGTAAEETPKDVVAPAVEGEAAVESTEMPAELTPRSNDENAPPANSTGKRPQRRRPAHKRGPPKEGVPSTTTVFVANLSYSCTAEKLKDYFGDYSPEWAHVALKRTPAFVLAKLAERGVTPRPPRALGFGFVRFADEETQKKAIAELNGMEFDGRAISVRVAIDSQIEKAKKEENGEVDGDEPADEDTVEAAAPAVEASA
ncbi:hypothetical protein V1504DRAFT_454074 [Lipomyces starkeyi]